MKVGHFIVIVLTLLVLSGCANQTKMQTAYETPSQPTKVVEPAIPSSDEECFVKSLKHLKEDLNIDVELKDITKFRCEIGVPYFQYEIEGLDFQGSRFFAHYLEAGMAASGADSVEDKCLFVNAEVKISEKVAGRDAVKSEGTCKFVTYPGKTISRGEYSFP